MLCLLVALFFQTRPWIAVPYKQKKILNTLLHSKTFSLQKPWPLPLCWTQLWRRTLSHPPQKWKLFMVKNAFYFTLKALLVVQKLNFLSWIFGHVEKTAWLEKYDQFQNLWHHDLINKQLQYNMPQLKGNHTVKFGLSVQHNKRNIFLQKSCRKWGRESTSRPLFVF